MTKTPRNSPCPCGSGKKFKRCCGDPVVLGERYKEEQKRAKALELERAKRRDDARAKAYKELGGGGPDFGWPHRQTPSVALIAMSVALGMLGGRRK